MLLILVRAIYAFVCAGAIVSFISAGASPGDTGESEFVPFFQGHEYLAFFIMWSITQVVTLIDILIPRKRIDVISSIYFGLLIGVLLSYLLFQALGLVFTALDVTSEVRDSIGLLTLLILPYLSTTILLQTKDDFRFVIPYVEFSRELKASRPLVLDSSALIDGRIGDIVDTHIFDAEMVVPQFILNEIQDIADSNEKIRRSRGRRGLEILNKLQNNSKVEIHIYDSKLSDFNGMSVDQALVELTKQLGGRVVTNDFNLNKVASVQGIPVINLNDVANALKPRYLPGERLKILLLKEGETPGQGIGYLDDGTMVVCEQASHLVGKEVDIVVTSALQSSAGRMIFGRQVHLTDHA